jgi:hypothetical protein
MMCDLQKRFSVYSFFLLKFIDKQTVGITCGQHIYLSEYLLFLKVCKGKKGLVFCKKQIKLFLEFRKSIN